MIFPAETQAEFFPVGLGPRILKAQLYEDNFVDPESQYLSFERLPHTGHSKVLH